MYRGLAEEQPSNGRGGLRVEFEEPHFITLGVCYEKNRRFAGGAYAPILKRVDKFLDGTFAKTLPERERRGDRRWLVRVGELFRDAVRLNAAGVILVHNHPSGDPTPSPDDLHLTAEALAAGRLLDISLLDHLVIGHDVYVSLRDRGVVFDRAGPGPVAGTISPGPPPAPGSVAPIRP